MAIYGNHAKTSRIAILISAIILHAAITHADVNATSLYGDDHRKDLYQVSDSLALKLADSTVALVKPSDLEDLKGKPGRFKIKSISFREDQRLCDSEKFVEQPVVAFCTGFLVAPDLVLTAGHCVLSDEGCTSKTKFIFGYAVKHEGKYPHDIAKSEVYSCAQVVKRRLTKNEADYALLKLDREVTGHQPLALNRNDDLTAGTPIMVIGNPSGLPTKVSADGTVRYSHAKDAFFNTNLDAYGGNSGSPVFNQWTGAVEGILVRGDRDFVKKGSCYVSYQCGSDEGEGEDVTKISEIADLIPQLPRTSATSAR